MQTTLNKKAIQASFSKAASNYDLFADLQREIGHVLLEKIPVENQQVNNLLDLGCGTGYFSSFLSGHSPSGKLTCFDLSSAMLQQTKQRSLTNAYLLQGDLDQLPFADSQFDLIFSNLAVQWSESLTNCLSQLNNTLNNNGVLVFSTLLNGSLIELQQAWKQIDDNPHINDFLQEQQIKKAMIAAGFTSFQIVTDTRTKKYKNVLSVMKALKGIGANHVNNNNNSYVKPIHTRKQLITKLEEGYKPFLDIDGLYPLSYEVCYVIAQQQS